MMLCLCGWKSPAAPFWYSLCRCGWSAWKINVNYCDFFILFLGIRLLWFCEARKCSLCRIDDDSFWLCEFCGPSKHAYYYTKDFFGVSQFVCLHSSSFSDNVVDGRPWHTIGHGGKAKTRHWYLPWSICDKR